jgi:hypothetical protein
MSLPVMALVIAVGLTCQSPRAEAAAPLEVTCVVEGDAAKLTFKGRPGKGVVIPGSSNICARGLNFFPSSKYSSEGLVLVAPVEPSLGASNEAYLVSFRSGLSRYAGELPVAAEPVTAASLGAFFHVHQSGGSIYFDRYDLRGGVYRLNEFSEELAVDGDYCVDEKRVIRQLGVSSPGGCPKKVSATFSEPLCILHRAGRSILSARKSCKRLEAFWGKR